MRDIADSSSSRNILFHLLANGQVQRVMTTLKSVLIAVDTIKDRSWQVALSEVQPAMNCTINRVTRSSPMQPIDGLRVTLREALSVIGVGMTPTGLKYVDILSVTTCQY